MGRVGIWREARAILCAFILFLPLVWCSSPVHAIEQSATIRVPILAYHNVDYSGSGFSVTPEQLDEQCRWLIENGYTAITLWQFWDAAMGSGTLPPNPVMLTNDDGWSSAMTFAEILGQHGLPATYFINNVSPLTSDQILVLSQLGVVEAHTVTHAHLAGMDYDSQLAEVSNNISYLEQITGQPIHIMAWPWGESDASAVQAAAAAGIVGAFGLGGTGAFTPVVDPYHIPRILMVPSDDLDTFAAKVSWW
jgi:peptidoglycan/xylan/chitin deacetylase (PgdA/CDA1 family)